MKQYIIRLLFKVDASGLKKQLQSISKEAAKVGAAMAKSMNRAFKTVAKDGGSASKQVVKSLDNIDKKASQSAKKVGDISSKFSDLGKTLVSGLLGVGAASAISSTIKSFASLEVGLQKLQAAANLFGKDFNTIKNDLIEIRKEGVLSFETLNYTARQLLTPAFNMAEKDVGRFIEALRNIAATEGIYEDLDFAITSFVRGLQTGTAELLENLSPRIRAFIQTDAGGFAKVQKDQAARQLLFNEILESGAKAQEDYERLLGTTEFTTRKLNQSVLELRESIGEGLAPVFNELVESLTGLTRGFTGLIETMTISQKSGVLVGTIFTTLGVILTPLIVKVGGLTAAMAGLGATLAAFAPTLGIIAALGVGLGFLTSKFVESRQSLTSLASEASKTTNSIAKLEKELSATNRLNDQKALLKLKKKQFELEGKIVDKIKDQVLSTVELRSAVRLLGAEGVQALQDSLIAEREILRERAKGQLGRFGDPVGSVGTTRRTEITKVLGEAATKNLELALTTGGEEAIAQAVRDLTAKVATGKTAARAAGVRSDLRQFILPLLKQLLGTQAGINEAQKQIIGITDPAGGGGGGAVMGAGGTPLSIGQRLGLNLEGRLIELERSFNISSKTLDDFRKKALDPTTEEYKALESSLEGVTKKVKQSDGSYKEVQLSVEDYLEKLEEEQNIRKDVEAFELARDEADATYDSLGKLATGFSELDGTLTGAAAALSNFTSSAASLIMRDDPTSKLGQGLSLFGGAFGFLSGIIGLFESDTEPVKTFQDILLERIADTQEKQLETLNRQLELSKTLAGITEDYYSNRLDAVNAQKERELASATTSEEIKAINIKANEDTLAILTEQLESIGFTGDKTIERLTELNNLTKSSREDTAKLQSALEGTGGSITANVRSIIRGTGIGAGELSQLETQEQSLSRLQALLRNQIARGRFGVNQGPLGVTGLSEEDAEFLRSLGLSGTFSERTVGGGRAGPVRTVTEFRFTPTPGGYDPILRGLQESIGDKIANLTAQINNLANVSEDEDDTTLKQIDLLEQFIDVQTQGLELQKEGNELAKASLTAIQPRGFGAVDVSRGGLAFGRDFIPTAASLISNVGVPAQIGNLSVAAEANKTMDQKMLDSLQNQLIELKAQTNLLAQLTNTDARIVIANAQQAVKATGF